MSGVEAISMACNVMTVISFSLETIKLYRSIHEAGSSDPELAKNVEHIQETSAKVERLLHEQQQLDSMQRVVTSDAEKRLGEIAAKCLQYSKDIQQEIASTSPKKPGILQALKCTMKTMWRKPHLDQLKGHLQASQSTMDTAVNLQILEQCIASGKLNREIYTKLDSETRQFIAMYEQRSQAVESLIRKLHGHVTKEHVATRDRIVDEQMATRKRIAKEHMRTRDNNKNEHTVTRDLNTTEHRRTRDDNINEHITTREMFKNTFDMMVTNSRQEQAHEKLLGSLAYNAMNSRKNSLHMNACGTLEWIFEGTKSDSESVTYSDRESESGNSSDAGTTARPNEHEDSWRRKQVATAKWNQVNTSLRVWLEEERAGAFWISGKPGSGKSTLVKFIMSNERTMAALRKWRPQPTIIAHFLWRPGTLLQQNFHGLLCSLLHQVLSIDVNVCAHLLHTTPALRRKHDETDWDTEELKRHLLEAFRLSERSYLILLDGLDEMDKPQRGLNEVFDFLDDLNEEICVKLCISSRPERVFRDRFSACQHLRMQDVNFGDICEFTLEFLDRMGIEPGSQMRQLITSTILAKAEGVFMWVHLALRSVRNGIEEFDEDWDDIYQRIFELPSDLSSLYRDMLSRPENKTEKYVKMAALHFQLIRHSERVNNIACLAVASNDAILESFTARNELPSPSKLAKACKHTHKSLFGICSGILEADSSFTGLFPGQSGSNMLQEDNIDSLFAAIRKWDSKEAAVRFTHTTVLDFLDSSAGEETFGEYAMDSEEIHSRVVNALIILGCMPYPHETEHSGIARIFNSLDSGLSRSKLSAQIFELFCRFSQHAHMIDDFSSPPPPFTSHELFIFAASCLGYFECVTRILRSDGNGHDATTAAALVGACEFAGVDESNEHDSQRHNLIRMCLQNYVQPEQAFSSQPDLEDSDQLSIAWRSFLLAELARSLRRDGGRGKISENTLATIESFISAGVLKSNSSARYLIEAEDLWSISLLSQRTIIAVESGATIFPGESAILLEVNDSFILRELCNRAHTASKTIRQAAKHATIRPVLARNPRLAGQKADIFSCTLKNDQAEEEFVDWVLHTRTLIYPEDVPGYLKLVHLGAYEDFFEALDHIGYSLPDVNKHHVRWHRFNRLHW